MFDFFYKMMGRAPPGRVEGLAGQGLLPLSRCLEIRVTTSQFGEFGKETKTTNSGEGPRAGWGPTRSTGSVGTWVVAGAGGWEWKAALQEGQQRRELGARAAPSALTLGFGDPQVRRCRGGAWRC